jgi:hypothetical protein
MATEVGLYELDLAPGAVPLQVEVDPSLPREGYYALAASYGPRGELKVAVAATEMKGVYLSVEGGAPKSFQKIGLDGLDVRCLEVEYDGPRSFLWAGLAAHGPDDPNVGVHVWELTGAAAPVDGWEAHQGGWRGGSCKGLAFLGRSSPGATMIAATHNGGVLRLNARQPGATWEPADIDCGLPHSSAERLFAPVSAVSAHHGVVMAGGERGSFRSDDGAATYRNVATAEFDEVVMLPDTWLFCSGAHEIEVVSTDEAG